MCGLWARSDADGHDLAADPAYLVDGAALTCGPHLSITAGSDRSPRKRDDNAARPNNQRATPRRSESYRSSPQSQSQPTKTRTANVDRSANVALNHQAAERHQLTIPKATDFAKRLSSISRMSDCAVHSALFILFDQPQRHTHSSLESCHKTPGKICHGTKMRIGTSKPILGIISQLFDVEF